MGQSAAAMEEHTGRCEEAISTRQPAKMVDNTSSIARLMFKKKIVFGNILPLLGEI